MEGQIHKWADCINIQCELWLCHGLELFEDDHQMAESCRVRPEGDQSLSLPYHAYLSDSPRPIAINKPRSALSRKFRAEGFQG
jgi:hypothetical protein